LKFALGTRASGGFSTAPVALGLLAQGGTVGFRGNAGGAALSGGTHGLTFRAVVLLTHIFGASDAALRLLAVNSAFGTFRLLALHLTFRPRANGVALSRADWVVTLPSAFGVALCLSRNDYAQQSN